MVVLPAHDKKSHDALCLSFSRLFSFLGRYPSYGGTGSLTQMGLLAFGLVFFGFNDTNEAPAGMVAG